MMFTLKDARKLCAPIAMSGGGCAQTPVLDERINEAMRRMSRMYDLPEQTALLHVLARGNTLTLPREVKSARVVNVNLTPARIRHIGYEFSTSGPGQEAECDCGSISLIAEPGLFPTFFDLPHGRSLSIGAFMANPGPVPLDARIFARRANGEALWHGGRDGAPLRINSWRHNQEGEVDGKNSVFSEPVTGVEQISLPARQGYLTLLAMDKDTYETYFLGKYHPEETRPGYRRYRIRGVTCQEEHCVSLLVKLHPNRVAFPEDILPVQNLDALKQMVMGIREENARNFQEAQGFFAMAQSLLVSEMDDRGRGEEVMLAQKDDYGYGGGSLTI